MTYKFPGTPAETKVAEFLVASTGGHFVTIVRPVVGELLGVSIRGETVVIRDLMAALSTDAEPVAWRYRDFADGWILDHSERSAREYQRNTGCVMQALYTSPPTVAVAIENLSDEQVRHIADAKDVASCRSRVLSALSAQVQDVAGWQLVPKVLTEDMKDAHFNKQRSRFVAPEAQEIWDAMLAASPAPKPEEPEKYRNPDIFHDAEGRN